MVPATVRTRSALYHHDLLPNSKDESERYGSHHYPLITNSLGFRDSQVREVPLKSSRERLLVIGDSFTEGVGVPFEDSFVGILTRELAQKDVEVMNAGVSSYSPITYYRKTKYLLEEKGLKFDEVVVFLDLSDIQDETFYHFDTWGNIKGLEWPHDAMDVALRYQLGNFGYFLEKNLRMTARAYLSLRCRFRSGGCFREPLGNSRARWTIDPELFEAYGKKGLALATENMDKLAQLLRSRQIPLTLVVYPWPDQIAAKDLLSKQVTHWEAWAKVNQVEFLDVFPLFIDENQLGAVWKEYFLPKDAHWNAKGHAAVAEFFTAHYHKQALTPRDISND